MIIHRIERATSALSEEKSLLRLLFHRWKVDRTKGSDYPNFTERVNSYMQPGRFQYILSNEHVTNTNVKNARERIRTIYAT
jgi:hypothetical protein